jgi:hypothetical protein
MPRYRDYDPDEDIDRDPDEEYRRRAERYGPEYDEEEETEEEKDSEESERVARKKCLGPGVLMVVAGLLTLLGSLGYLVSIVLASGAGAPGAGPGAAVTVVQLAICGGLPILAVLTFSALQAVGGACLLQRKRRGMAISGGILGGLAVGVIVLCGVLMGFPAGVWFALGPSLLSIPAAVWLLVALSDHDVQEAFDRARRLG